MHVLYFAANDARLGDRDIFEKYFKQHLSKRLLNNQSVSEEAERAIVAKLKMECGFQLRKAPPLCLFDCCN